MSNGDGGAPIRSALVREMNLFLLPLGEAMASEQYRDVFLRKMGWDPTKIPVTELPEAVQSLFNAVRKLENLASDQPETMGDYLEVIETVGAVFRAIKTFQESIEFLGSLDEDDLELFMADLVNTLLTTYLENRHPAVYDVALLLTVIEQTEGAEGTVVKGPDGGVVRNHGPNDRFAGDKVGDLLSEPGPTLSKAYFGSGGLDSVEAGRSGMRELLPRSARLVNRFGLDVAVNDAQSGLNTPPGWLTNSPACSGTPIGSLILEATPLANVDFQTFCFFQYDKSEGQPTALLVPATVGTFAGPLGGGWQYNIEASAAAGGLCLTPEDISTKGGATASLQTTVGKYGQASGSGSGSSGSGSRPAYVIGGKKSTRLELGTVSFSGGTELATGSKPGGDVLAKAEDSALVLSPDDAGNFLQQILPDEEIRVDFDLGVGWSTAKGVYVVGGGGVEVTLPIHKSVFGVVTVETVEIGIRFGDRTDAALTVDLGITPTLTIGPIAATVRGLGLSTDFTFPKQGTGNLGPADADFGFKPPDGVGLGVSAGPVTGEGFLGFEPEKHRYSGALRLEIHDYAITVVGLLKTKLPGGEEGYSLLLLVTGELPPIDLGFGFKLTGIGGLLGVHRNMKTKPLQTAVRTGNLNSVLFPQNVVENAQQIITDLRTIFPVKKDIHVFGPMAKFAWGTSSMITMDVGIVLSIPTWKIAILGKIRMALPDPDQAIVDLKLGVIGVLDIPNKKVAIDASLYDSRIAVFTVAGDMALRSSWGEKSSFMLSLGGFHPRYSPPKSFPKLDRIQASLSKSGGGASARIELSAYLAVTPNTFQVGAGVLLDASAGPAHVHGELSFDALFHFDPFSFVIDYLAKLLVEIKKFKLGIEVDGTLKGPKPMRIKGKVKINVALLTVKTRIDVSIGSKPDKQQLETARVFPQLTDALSRSQNWDATRPEGNAAPVSLRNPTTGDSSAGGQGGQQGGGSGGAPPVLVHPLGTVSVRQTVVPLDVDIEKFGNAKPRNTRFAIDSFELAGTKLPGLEPLREEFAPARFHKMSDSEKLNSEAFEKLPAGRRFRNDRYFYAGENQGSVDPAKSVFRTATMAYESTVIDEANDVHGRTPNLNDEYRTLSATVSTELLKTGAVATSDARTTGSDRYRSDGGSAGRHSGGEQAVSVSDTGYVVVHAGSLNHVEMGSFADADNPIAGTTQVEARQAKRAYVEAGHASADDLRVVASHEVRSWVVVAGSSNSRVDMGNASVSNPKKGVRKSEAREAMETFRDSGQAPAGTMRVVPVHAVGTQSGGS